MAAEGKCDKDLSTFEWTVSGETPTKAIGQKYQPQKAEETEPPREQSGELYPLKLQAFKKHSKSHPPPWLRVLLQGSE